MSIGHFLWADLSTYDLQAAKADYGMFFNWSFSANSEYHFARQDHSNIAALFVMPEMLAKIDMPSFWMSYVHVEDINASVAKARQHPGVIIEVEPHAFDQEAYIALVRDPSGAGFTLYQGPDITPQIHGAGTVQSRFHHLSKIDEIQNFYTDLFDWRFEKITDEPWPVYNIIHPDGSRIAQVEEVPKDIRGKFSYWMPCFSVENLQEKIELICKNGGEKITDLPQDRAMMADRQGAHFMITSSPKSNMSSQSTKRPTHRPSVWKSVVALVCVWLAVFFNIQAIWGILFLIWTIPGLKTGRVEFIGPIDRRDTPLVYWAVIGTWIFMSLWMLLSFLPSGDVR